MEDSLQALLEKANAKALDLARRQPAPYREVAVLIAEALELLPDSPRASGRSRFARPARRNES